MSTDPEFPVLSVDDQPRPACVTCGRPTGEPGEFLCLNAGAVLHTDATRQTGGPAELMSAYFTLIKHGAEPDGPYVTLDVVHDLTGGQADLYFCSARCLRRFFTVAVDELERRWTGA